MMPTIDDLILRAKEGDDDAFAQLYTIYQHQICAFCYHLMGDHDVADDLTQDTFVKAYRAIARTGNKLNILTWLYRIALNTCLDALRRQQRLRMLPWEGPKHDQLLLAGRLDEPDHAADVAEDVLAVQRTLDRMGPRNRLGLVLREYEDLSCTEIGEVLGMSRSATKSMLFRARAEFRAVYAHVTAPPTSQQPVI